MIIILTILLLATCVVAISKVFDGIESTGGILSFMFALFSGGALILEIALAAIVNIPANVEAEKAKMIAQYEALTTAAQNNDSIILLAGQIGEYNGTIQAGRIAMHDEMFGIFFYQIYDDLPIIEYEEKYESEE